MHYILQMLRFVFDNTIEYAKLRPIKLKISLGPGYSHLPIADMTSLITTP